ncbi:MAG: NUDIX hydrolase [Paracoccaceae bacterium]|nr:NUDIX hydrolase [Paracoccaceae bacterium]
MIARFGESPLPHQKYIRRPGVYAVLERGGQVLLTFQDDPHHEFQLPGGGIDPGEHPIAALHREVFEETGWRISSPRRLGAFRRFTFMPEYDLWAEKVCSVYLARPVIRLGPPLEPDHSAHFVPAETAPDLIDNTGDRHFLMRALGFH